MHYDRDDHKERVKALTERIRAARTEASENGAAIGSRDLRAYRKTIDQLASPRHQTMPPAFGSDVGILESEWERSLQQDWATNTRVINEMEAAVLEFQDLRRGEYLEQVPRIIGEICGFQKVLFSVVQGTHWIPVTMWAKDPSEITAIRLDKYLKDNPVIRLVGRLPEAEMARRRRPLLVMNALTDPHTHKPPIVLSNATDYAGAPLFVDGRIAGFLHIDRAIQARPPNETDMLWLHRYASIVAGMYSITLSSRREKRTQTNFDRVSLMLNELRPCGGQSFVSPEVQQNKSGPAPRKFNQVESLPMSRLSAREYQVLQELSKGMTNQAIATELCVSIHTVRTHVRQILKKMRVTNRAAAVAGFHSALRERSDG
ncbi:LuxR C-terminal-related transcriptional regulator [Nocardia alni]|uniref:LuxR C-terminal-related transcriptional regulator n=1 Tax=Nocardia alni TaxID=2815723 RepID=UPI001C2479B5|nr:LuxR C-terminal-related transcriptional regulator [Nocardia alni]